MHLTILLCEILFSPKKSLVCLIHPQLPQPRNLIAASKRYLKLLSAKEVIHSIINFNRLSFAFSVPLFSMDACTTDLCKIQSWLLLNGLPLRWKWLKETRCIHLQPRDFHLAAECCLPKEEWNEVLVQKMEVKNIQKKKKRKRSGAKICIFKDRFTVYQPLLWDKSAKCGNLIHQ